MPLSKAKKKFLLRQVLFALGDGVASMVVWASFFVFRKIVIEPEAMGFQIPVEFDHNFYLGLALSPPFWIGIHALSGFYKEIDRRSRLHVFLQTLGSVSVGVIIMFFLVFLDDMVAQYSQYYQSLFMFFGAMLVCTLIPRMLLTTYFQHLVNKGILRINTLLVGGDDKAVGAYLGLSDTLHISAHRFIGFVAENESACAMDAHLTRLGHINQARRILLLHDIEEVILAEESTAHFKLQHLITLFSEKGVRIKMIPDLFNIVSGTVKFSSLFDTPLMEVQALRMPVWQQVFKRFADMLLSALALIVLAPVFLIVALAIRTDSRGPIFYSHERIGRYGKPFQILKFRSMIQNAEAKGPALSSDKDSRVTKVGQILRKYRIDEFPQFINVLKGDMSLVGPRPERQFFISQIEEKAPHYRLLHRVKPGITSWGQVKYGYASNVDEMLERLRYDLLYIENMSLLLDAKILFYTLRTVLRAEGK
jgi:exopolysaccharide biosynthesis polyprenyl glycosylphosphotransferase